MNIPITKPPVDAQERLKTEKNIWVASARPNGRPHLAPVWFAWHAGRLYLCIEPESVKGRNIRQNPHLSLSLEDGSKVVICEGTAAVVSTPWPPAVIDIFQQKYNWHIPSDGRYTQLLAVTPMKWLTW